MCSDRGSVTVRNNRGSVTVRNNRGSGTTAATLRKNVMVVAGGLVEIRGSGVR